MKNVGVEVGTGDGIGVAVGIAICVPTIFVLAIETAVSITLGELIAGVELKRLQAVKITATRNSGIFTLLMIFMIPLLSRFIERNAKRLALLTGAGAERVPLPRTARGGCVRRHHSWLWEQSLEPKPLFVQAISSVELQFPEHAAYCRAIAPQN